MFKRPAEVDRFNWWLPLSAVLGTIILFVPATIYEPDGAFLAYAFVGVLISLSVGGFSLDAWFARKNRQCLSILRMLVIYWSTSVVLFGNYMSIRTAARWLVLSRDYKGRVLAEPTSPNGEFKHVEWDGWGWAGQDTTVYLVFDPKDSLSAAARNHQSGKFKGIPCEVNVVRHLESQLYTAQFYTNEFWGHCIMPPPGLCRLGILQRHNPRTWGAFHSALFL
jgi:hypothetical protein